MGINRAPIKFLTFVFSHWSLAPLVLYDFNALFKSSALYPKKELNQNNIDEAAVPKSNMFQANEMTTSPWFVAALVAGVQWRAYPVSGLI